MIALVVAIRGDVDAAAAALERCFRGLPFFAGQSARTWQSTGGEVGAAWLVSVDAGGRPLDSERDAVWTSPERAVFILGRPLRWGAEAVERSGVVDPAMLATELDGRGAVVRLGPSGVDVIGDPMHAYPFYGAPASGWVSNVPGVFRRPASDGANRVEQTSASHRAERHAATIRGGSSLVGSRIASAVAYGSSFDGAPWLAGVVRLGGDALPDAMRGSGTPPDHRLDRVRVHRAAPPMAERGGRDLVVPLSAGRDSRLILAAALAAELPVRTVTGGAEGSADVLVGRWLAAAAGLDHRLIDAGEATRTTEPIPTIDLVSRIAEGVVTAGDAHFFPHGPAHTDTTWLTGQGGEIGRAFYGGPAGPATIPLLGLRLVSRRPGRPLPLTAGAQRQLAGAVARRLRGLRRAGARTGEIGDLLYLGDRMGRHLSGALVHFELGFDYASPLWSRRLLPHLWAGSIADRRRSSFHDAVTLELASRLPREIRAALEEAVAGTAPTAARGFAAVASETGATHPPRGSGAVEPGGADVAALVAAQGRLGELADMAGADDSIWSTLSRRRVVELAGRDPDRLDFIERQHVWRLATALTSWLR